MDNQRLLIWGFFAIMAYLTWQTWMEDYGPEPVPPPPVADEAADPLAPVDDLPGVSATDDALPAVGTPQDVDAAVTPTAEPQPIITVRTDVLEIEINPVGGVLQRAVMLGFPVEKDDPDTLVELLSPQIDDLGLIRSWLRAVDGQPAPDRASIYETTAEVFELGSDDEIVVPLTWRHESGLAVEKRFVFRRGSYAIGVEQTVTNGTGSTWVGDQVTQNLRRSRDPERSMFNVDSYSFDGPQVFDGKGAEKLGRDDLQKETFQITTDDGWIASLQHHFLSAIVPAEGTTNTIQVQVRDNVMTASVIESPARSIAPGASDTFTRTLFVGPKLQAQLREVHPRLTLSVDYGWLTILSQPMFWLLSWIYKFVGNWGWAIIGVTIVIKLAFYRLSESSGRSMAKMRELQPRMKALQDRYKDDRQALSQAMMDLYKREKINPAAGCLPILIQMPFFLAFYWVLVESVEMRQAPFALWITDLSSRDPFFILPLIMGAAMLFQQKLNPAPADPVQARVMQIMPIMFTAFFAFFPSGLVLYWVTNTLLSIAQQWKINKVVHQEALDKKSGKDRKGKKKKKDAAE